ncbi:MAG: hypothetical protein LUQ44_00115 [Methanothrix sp.]|nr:hypothetical protein [Methanothrix sp.]
MREQIVLVSLLIFWASIAHAAAGAHETSLDIIGSKANNTSIIVPEGTAIGVDIVGSSVSNIKIAYPDQRKKQSCREEKRDCGPCGEEKRYETPWDDFTRPLCYPWSSYIPTRYNRQFIRGGSDCKSGLVEPLPLGRGGSYS